jgi:hypothetical protein
MGTGHMNARTIGILTAGLSVLAVSGCKSVDSSANANGGSSGSSTGSGGSAFGLDGGSAFMVSRDAAVCQDDLAFKVPGCSCHGEPNQACWTGQANMRNVGQCHDGLQKCSGDGEFDVWGPCEGENLSCDTGDAAQPEDAAQLDGAVQPDAGGGVCLCVPGVTIGCDEDCEAHIICSLSGYKTCLPDGTWGTCHETANLAGATGNLTGCRNVLHGCGLGAEEGLFTGDCSGAFTCGKAPGSL